jgi:hypothetical protein
MLLQNVLKDRGKSLNTSVRMAEQEFETVTVVIRNGSVKNYNATERECNLDIPDVNSGSIKRNHEATAPKMVISPLFRTV